MGVKKNSLVSRGVVIREVQFHDVNRAMAKKGYPPIAVIILKVHQSFMHSSTNAVIPSHADVVCK
jgi:hypothetical protein